MFPLILHFIKYDFFCSKLQNNRNYFSYKYYKGSFQGREIAKGWNTRNFDD